MDTVSYGRLFNKGVKNILAEKNIWVVEIYNDRHKKSRRLSYVANKPADDAKAEEIVTKVRELVEAKGVKAKVYWHESEMYMRGTYTKLCIKIPLG